MAPMPLPHERPAIDHDVSTADLPALPQRDRSIPASRWREAPPELFRLSDDIVDAEPVFLRRIGRYLLWRAGSPQGAWRALALAADNLSEQWTFAGNASEDGNGVGPDGVTHIRFRHWKESLRDASAR